MQITTGARTFQTDDIQEIHEFPSRGPVTRKLCVHVGGQSREEVHHLPAVERSLLLALLSGSPVPVHGEAEVRRVLSLIEAAAGIDEDNFSVTVPDQNGSVHPTSTQGLCLLH